MSVLMGWGKQLKAMLFTFVYHAPPTHTQLVQYYRQREPVVMFKELSFYCERLRYRSTLCISLEIQLLIHRSGWLSGHQGTELNDDSKWAKSNCYMLAEVANPLGFIEGFVERRQMFNSVYCSDSVFIHLELHVLSYGAFLHHKVFFSVRACFPSLFLTYGQRREPVDTIIPSDLWIWQHVC